MELEPAGLTLISESTFFADWFRELFEPAGFSAYFASFPVKYNTPTSERRRFYKTIRSGGVNQAFFVERHPKHRKQHSLIPTVK